MEKRDEFDVYWDRSMAQKGILQLSLVEQKTLLFICMKIEGKEDTNLVRTFDVREYCRDLGIDFKSGGNYTRIKRALKEMGDKSWWFSDKRTKRTSLLRWFDRVYIDERSGIVTVRIHEDLAECLFKLKEYIQFKGIIGLAFKSKYSLPLYTMLKSYIGNLHDPNFSFDLKAIKQKLNAENYEFWEEFKKHVLERAIKDINAVSQDIVIDGYEKIKTGRKVTDIRFIVHDRSNTGYQLDENGKAYLPEDAKLNAEYNALERLEPKSPRKPRKKKTSIEEVEQYRLDLTKGAEE
jgi:plasmid replication initiation protein